MDHLADNVNEATQYIVRNLTSRADVGVILGSGLSQAAAELGPEAELAYEQISHFPVSGVKGHPGKLLLCRVGGKSVLVLQGRFHYYEGYTMKGVTFPIRVLARLGVKNLILTNAAGGLNRRFKTGDFMIVTDHLNFMGDNPLIGVSEEVFGMPFVDLRGAYDRRLTDLAASVAASSSVRAHRGVLAAVAGPSYETPAEARWLMGAGADAVTMSTVPETLVGVHSGMTVLGISCITNVLWSEERLSHNDVVRMGEEFSARLAPWLREVIRSL